MSEVSTIKRNSLLEGEQIRKPFPPTDPSVGVNGSVQVADDEAVKRSVDRVYKRHYDAFKKLA